MIEYLLFDPACCPMKKQERMPVNKRVGIRRPEGAEVYLNGHLVAGTGEIAWICGSSLLKHNTVRMRCGGVEYRCQGFAFDGTSLTPEPLDGEQLLAHLVPRFTALEEQVRELLAYVEGEKRRELRPLFS
ncbi:MAG: hypothetical protein IJC29_02600 [Clostridia bacterium]|nr:hypothetical protein [Clostridia bacterium]